jgi:hypothetical protein
MIILQQWGLFETNSLVQKFPSTFLFSHSLLSPSFPSSILNRIPLYFSPLLSLSGYLVVFPKMSNYAGWRTHRFTFLLMILYHGSDRPLPHSIHSHFFDHGFPGRWALDCTSIVFLPKNNTQTSAIYKLTVGLPHHPLFYVTHFSLKSYEPYNLTVGASRLLGNPCQLILKLV